MERELRHQLLVLIRDWAIAQHRMVVQQTGQNPGVVWREIWPEIRDILHLLREGRVELILLAISLET